MGGHHRLSTRPSSGPLNRMRPPGWRRWYATQLGGETAPPCPEGWPRTTDGLPTASRSPPRTRPKERPCASTRTGNRVVMPPEPADGQEQRLACSPELQAPSRYCEVGNLVRARRRGTTSYRRQPLLRWPSISYAISTCWGLAALSRWFIT